MIINPYETTAGAPFKVIDKIEGTIKTLELMNALTRTTKPGVFVVTHAENYGIPVFAFPITTLSHSRETITVYDERPYRNKSNVLTNAPEAMIIRLAAFLQHDCAHNNFTPLKNGRILAVRSFAGALGNLFGLRAGLDVMENLHLKILLSYYFVGLMENPNHDYKFVVSNVVRTVFGTDMDIIQGVIDDLPYIANIKELIDVINKTPALYKLKGLNLKDFLGLTARISFSAVGKHVVNASLEAPCLFTAIVYGTIQNKLYAKTPLGIQLDPKYNKGVLEAFVKNVDYTYDLKVK
ncbi:hypothetical protein JOAD_245 [Erwinia phage vB_EamM_Joad]|uniref:Virion structural protein n=1 Tax=Erwinia phage vB_EamM_Joad TaxID=2026081 RepID=A0A223LI64_9CAUD|nr:hypothetical protein JOAD_245 [Erwinia phage vB_EamM_Joad]